ncbi:hypothetical protein NPIL_546891 [Nephila pilipes]|uniref:Uncharacterized protein n=1 Tax=Nephila pilipes TaxID=299642 RepID=A0A8X6QV41_NEPPI|nr:hypothetical protein NPIL_546891 [Nephila pilipes]
MEEKLVQRERIDRSGRPHVRPVTTPLKVDCRPPYHIPPQEVGSINPSRCAGNHWGSLFFSPSLSQVEGNSTRKQVSIDPPFHEGKKDFITSLPPVTDPSSFTPFA